MGLKLNINVDKLIKYLIKSNKKSRIRDRVSENREDLIIKDDVINCQTDKTLTSIIKNAEAFEDVVDNYAINSRFVDMAIAAFPNNVKCIILMIQKHAELLTVEHVKKLIGNTVMQMHILENKDNLSDEVYCFLIAKRLIKMGEIPYERKGSLVKINLVKQDIMSMNSVEIRSVVCLRLLSSEELSFVIETIQQLDSKDKDKLLYALMRYQILSGAVVEKIVKEVPLTVGEIWFRWMLEKQNLDRVLDFILENYSLTKYQMELIFQNQRTSKRKLAELYSENVDIIVNCKAPALPVFGCHVMAL